MTDEHQVHHNLNLPAPAKNPTLGLTVTSDKDTMQIQADVINKQLQSKTAIVKMKEEEKTKRISTRHDTLRILINRFFNFLEIFAKSVTRLFFIVFFMTVAGIVGITSFVVYSGTFDTLISVESNITNSELPGLIQGWIQIIIGIAQVIIPFFL